jgi:hypothetical protein
MSRASHIAGSLRRQDWAQIAIEFVMLVVGIVIALSLDSWLQDRRDERVERGYLQSLVRDLDDNRSMFEGQIEYERGLAEGAAVAVRALRGETADLDRTAVEEALNALTSRRTLRVARPTYTDLLSTGNLRLIRNADLRRQVIALYESNERVTAIVARNNQFFVDELYARHVIGSGLFAYSPGSNLRALFSEVQALAELLEPQQGRRESRLWSLATDDPQREALASLVYGRASACAVAISLASDALARTAEVRGALVEELERRWPGTSV